jgi:hypothetical protein
LDSAGDLFIADEDSGFVREVNNGIITTIAGNTRRDLGSGGPATDAAIGSPQGVALDANGDLFIADYLILQR